MQRPLSETARGSSVFVLRQTQLGVMISSTLTGIESSDFRRSHQNTNREFRLEFTGERGSLLGK